MVSHSVAMGNGELRIQNGEGQARRNGARRRQAAARIRFALFSSLLKKPYFLCCVTIVTAPGVEAL